MDIREMRPEDLDFAASLTADEGWLNRDTCEFQMLYAHDPSGCFVAEEGGPGGRQRVGMVVATPYGAAGFIGYLIVVPSRRGLGLGRALLEHGLDYLRRRGAPSVLLDGTAAGVPLYEKVGFRTVAKSLRLKRDGGAAAGTTDAPADPGVAASPRVRPMEPTDLLAVLELDRAAFLGDRGLFLDRLLTAHPRFCFVLERRRTAGGGGAIDGFIMAKPEPEAVTAGPWVVAPGAEHPEALLQAVIKAAGAKDIRLGVLDKNAEAVVITRRLGFKELRASSRMAFGPPHELASSDRLYAIGSPGRG